MSDRPWMPLYVNDFRLDTLDLDCAQVGVYMALLMLAWKRDDATIPDDMEWLLRSLKSCFAEFHGHQFNRIVPSLLRRYFELGDDHNWRNKRLTNERQKADKLSVKQKQNADKRWAEYNKNKDLPDAEAMPLQLQLQSQLQEERKKEPSLRSVAHAPPDDVPHETPDGWPADFREIFWTAYPRKVGKATALRCLERVRKSGIAFDLVLAGVERIPKQDLQFVPHPTTWLGRGGWDDQEIQGAKANGYKPTNGAARQSGGADFFAGLKEVAANIAGNGAVAGPAAEEIPLGRVNIDAKRA